MTFTNGHEFDNANQKATRLVCRQKHQPVMCGLNAAQPRLQTLGKPPHRECRQLANRLVSRMSRRRRRRLFLRALQQRPQQRRAPQVLRCRGGVLRVFQGSVGSLYECRLCMWLPSTGACCDAWTPQGTMPLASAPKPTSIPRLKPTWPRAGSEGLGGNRSASEASMPLQPPSPRLMRVRAGLGVAKPGRTPPAAFVTREFRNGRCTATSVHTLALPRLYGRRTAGQVQVV